MAAGLLEPSDARHDAHPYPNANTTADSHTNLDGDLYTQSNSHGHTFAHRYANRHPNSHPNTNLHTHPHGHSRAHRHTHTIADGHKHACPHADAPATKGGCTGAGPSRRTCTQFRDVRANSRGAHRTGVPCASR